MSKHSEQCALLQALRIRCVDSVCASSLLIRRDLRVVVMSATLDTDVFFSFFQNPTFVSIRVRTRLRCGEQAAPSALRVVVGTLCSCIEPTRDANTQSTCCTRSSHRQISSTRRSSLRCKSTKVVHVLLLAAVAVFFETLTQGFFPAVGRRGGWRRFDFPAGPGRN